LFNLIVYLLLYFSFGVSPVQAQDHEHHKKHEYAHSSHETLGNAVGIVQVHEVLNDFWVV